jgi:subtilisin family serine protease
MRRTRLARAVITIAAIALALPGGGPVAARDVVARPHVVLMTGEPIRAYDGGVRGYAATRSAAGVGVDRSSAAVGRYASYLRTSHDRSLRLAGARPATKLHDYAYALDGYAAMLTPTQVATLRAQHDVLRVMPDELRQPATDSSPHFLRLDAPGGPYASGYDGEGVVIGIIDSGIWPEHPSFADDGRYPAPRDAAIPCEFGNTAHNPNDAPFACNHKLIGARQMLATYRAVEGADPGEFDSARDDSGHGTHSASIAAGNAGVEAHMFGRPVATIAGVAPRAEIVAYKALGELGGFTSDLAAAIDQAVADGVDVIDYAISGSAGTPGADEVALLFAADAGVFVAAADGNGGPEASTVGDPASMPWVTSVGASTQRRAFRGLVILGNGERYTGASLSGELPMTPLVDGEDGGSAICRPGALEPDRVAGRVVLCVRGSVGRLEQSEAVARAGGVGMIVYDMSDAFDPFTDSHWVPTVLLDRNPGLAIKAYIHRSSKPRARIDTRTNEDAPRTGHWRHAPTVTAFSGRGPNSAAPDVIKPDVVAPGLSILAGQSPYPDADMPPGELFQAIAGTSVASSHVAGVYALLKQAHPDWTAAEAKSALMTTASQSVRDVDRVTRADPFAMGAGQVRPGGRWGRGSIAQPGLVYDAGLYQYAAFTCGIGWGVFAPGQCAFLEDEGVPSKPADLNLPSIGISDVPGRRTVQRTVTSVTGGTRAVTFRAHVEAPPGFRVTVSPSTLRLRDGEQATFSVTVTNVDAPIGAWRFGALTWRADGYAVRSAIAVRPTALAAPPEVSGSGPSGSASIPVRFGYRGRYTAEPHGLIGATVSQGEVHQDPDRVFEPGDAGFGATLHELPVDDAAHLRVALPPESTAAGADLDLYVVDPSGTQVASSTAGGTNELVDISDPADGIWRVYVYGFSTPGPTVGYDLWTWTVPGAIGGSLSIASAPKRARMARDGAVVVAWSGLPTGAIDDWYLGLVTHRGPDGVHGRTLITIDDRH